MLVSGPIGDHGITVMLARGELDIEADIASDTAPLHGLVERAARRRPRACACLRDATRGGVATILNEIARAAEVAVVVDEDAVPVRPERDAGPARSSASTRCTWPARAGWSRSSTATQADAALAALRSHPLGEGAAVIGRVTDDPPGLVLLKTVVRRHPDRRHAGRRPAATHLLKGAGHERAGARGRPAEKSVRTAPTTSSPAPGREISDEEREGVGPTDMDATSALGVGESISRRGEDVDKQEDEPGRDDAGTKGPSDRPVGTSDERDATSVDPDGSAG